MLTLNDLLMQMVVAPLPVMAITIIDVLTYSTPTATMLDMAMPVLIHTWQACMCVSGTLTYLLSSTAYIWVTLIGCYCRWASWHSTRCLCFQRWPRHSRS